MTILTALLASAVGFIVGRLTATFSKSGGDAAPDAAAREHPYRSAERAEPAAPQVPAPMDNDALPPVRVLPWQGRSFSCPWCDERWTLAGHSAICLCKEGGGEAHFHFMCDGPVNPAHPSAERGAMTGCKSRFVMMAKPAPAPTPESAGPRACHG